MNFDPSIRQATPTDADWLTSCTDEAYGIYVSILGRKPLLMTMDYLAALNDFDVWIAEYRGKKAGLLVLEHKKDHTVIYSVAVLPNCSGQGIGKLLLKHAEQVAVAKGFNQLRLYTYELMTRNLAIYRSFGYVDSHITEYKGLKVIHLKKLLSD